VFWQIILKNFNGSAEDKIKLTKWVKILYRTLIMFAVLLLVLKAVNMSSVNEIPRSVIDRTTPDNMKENFEQKMKKASEQAKVINDSIKQSNK
jgi:hypothetical protein